MEAAPKSAVKVLRKAWCASLLHHQKAYSPPSLATNLLAIRDFREGIRRAESNLVKPVSPARQNDLFVSFALPDITSTIRLKNEATLFANARHRLKILEKEFAETPTENEYNFAQNINGTVSIHEYLQRVESKAVGLTELIRPQLDKAYPFVNRDRLFKHALRMTKFFGGYGLATLSLQVGFEKFGWPGMLPTFTILPFVASPLRRWWMDLLEFARAIGNPDRQSEYEKWHNHAEATRILEHGQSIKAAMADAHEFLFLYSTTEILTPEELAEITAAGAENRPVAAHALLPEPDPQKAAVILLIDEFIYQDPETREPKLFTFLRWRPPSWIYRYLEPDTQASSAPEWWPAFEPAHVDKVGN